MDEKNPEEKKRVSQVSSSLPRKMVHSLSFTSSPSLSTTTLLLILVLDPILLSLIPDALRSLLL